jgi:hypothetical protein
MGTVPGRHKVSPAWQLTCYNRLSD